MTNDSADFQIGDDGLITRTISEMCLTPNNQPGDQKNQWQKNRRGNSQPASELAPLDLWKTSDRRDMRRISSSETIKGQYASDDAAIDQNIGNACHPRNNSEEEVLLFGQQRIASLRGGIGDDRIPGEKKRLCRHQPGQSLHDQIVFVLDLVPDSSIPIDRTKQIDCGHTHGLLTYPFSRSEALPSIHKAANQDQNIALSESAAPFWSLGWCRCRSRIASQTNIVFYLKRRSAWKACLGPS